MSTKPLVVVLMGSISDRPVMQRAWQSLDEMGIPYEVLVTSAHRSPDKTANFAASARKRGIKVIIAGAGGAAHLAGVIAAHTTLPVIGVPIASSPLSGLDSLLSVVQMPPGVPVATVGVGDSGARNAGLLAAQILALSDATIAKRLEQYRIDQVKRVEKMDQELQDFLKKK